MSGGDAFRPLDRVRTIMEDKALGAAERTVLIALALATNNGSWQVTTSDAELCRRFNLSRATFYRVRRSKAFTRYIGKRAKNGDHWNHTLRRRVLSEAEVSQAETPDQSQSETPPVSQRDSGCLTVRLDQSQSVTQSAQESAKESAAAGAVPHADAAAAAVDREDEDQPTPREALAVGVVLLDEAIEARLAEVEASSAAIEAMTSWERSRVLDRVNVDRVTPLRSVRVLKDFEAVDNLRASLVSERDAFVHDEHHCWQESSERFGIAHRGLMRRTDEHADQVRAMFRRLVTGDITLDEAFAAHPATANLADTEVDRAFAEWAEAVDAGYADDVEVDGEEGAG